MRGVLDDGHGERVVVAEHAGLGSAAGEAFDLFDAGYLERGGRRGVGGIALYEEGHEDGPLGVRATAMFSSWLLDGARKLLVESWSWN